MAWDQLSINKPHLVYIILGGFTSLFMLCSSIIKERLYIGEATVATLCGIIFGPHAANLISPSTWGNVDQITLEFSRIVLVVQCFAVGVELPKAYMERHWRSVTLLLIPVMTFGWLITSLFIWGLFHNQINWLHSLAIAACVTATDPVLASSVVGKGKFAKRVPKHLRDLLSAESGCNDGMAFPFIYLALYIIRYEHEPGHVAEHWIAVTILYECIFGAIYGVTVGYIARRLIRYAHEKELIDRESFLVFYFVLALFCAGSGSILGIDDLLVGFAAGVGFSNDGWFTEKTEESHVSNVIDLLINLTFFVYFGTIIPWEQFNNGYLGMDVWKLVVLGILVLLFRRIPIMMLLKPIIPDIKTWREAMFAGHFGPIGVGAIFVAILARAELETGETTPLKEIPAEGTPNRHTIYLIWPITTFLVICSIVVHGSSIAVFTLGKHINTLSLTMSYTTANEQGHWTDRLPRIQSRSRTSMSIARSESSFDEKNIGVGQFPLGPPGTFLRRQREEDNPSRAASRASSRHRSRRSRNWDNHGPGGPITQSAIGPARRPESPDRHNERTDSDGLASRAQTSSSDHMLSPESAKRRGRQEEPVSPGEIYEEGHQTVYEDEEGNVLAVEPSHGEDGPDREQFERREGRRLMREESERERAQATTEKDDSTPERDQKSSPSSEERDKKTDEPPERPAKGWRSGFNKMSSMNNLWRRGDGQKPAENAEKKQTRGPARAYQYGNTIILEDEDGEVIKKYDIPAPERKTAGGVADPAKSRQRLKSMSHMLGLGGAEAKAENAAAGAPADDGAAGAAGHKQVNSSQDNDDDDPGLRFTITSGGRRMSKAEFIDKIRNMDPKTRVEAVEDSNAPEPVKREARKDYREQARASVAGASSSRKIPIVREQSHVEKKETAELAPADEGDENELKVVDSNYEVPFHDVSAQLRKYQMSSGEGETAAERRRRLALQAAQAEEEDSEDDGTERVPPAHRRGGPVDKDDRPGTDTGETAAERRRREGALGISKNDDSSDSEDDNRPRVPPQRQNIRFADQTPGTSSVQQPRPSALRWGKNVGR